MNAILGITRPGDFGVDMMHYNVHKTFTGPHGAGGPGAGPIAVRKHVGRRSCPRRSLPGPASASTSTTIGPSRSAACAASSATSASCCAATATSARWGRDGLREVSENAVLNANYLLSRVKGVYDVPHGDRCMHEFVASARALRRERKISAMDIGKRLLDFGYHAPTVYFPLVVPEALMIEPTETESKETLDAFADALIRIRERGRRLPARCAAHARP